MDWQPPSIVGAACLAVMLFAQAASSQQLYQKMTGAQCTALGGRIITWTNTAGQGVQVGECYVPPRAASGPSVPSPGAPANNAAAALGVASGVLDLVGAVQGLSGSAADDAAPSAQSPSDEPSQSASAGNADLLLARAHRNFERGARLNREGQPCDAARAFALAARQLADAGDLENEKRLLFQASMSQADCQERQRQAAAQTKSAAAGPDPESFVYYCADPRREFGGSRYVGRGELCPSGRAPARLPRPRADDGDEKFVYYCPPENNVYDLTRPGRYVKPGEGCSKPVQKLPRPAEPKGDERFVIYCPDEENVVGSGRYVKAGEGCRGPRRSGSKQASTSGSDGLQTGSIPKLSPEVARQRQDAIDRLRERAGETQDEQEKLGMLAKADRWQQALDAQK